MTKHNLIYYGKIVISTHTLRGERDFVPRGRFTAAKISTHTLRGERDERRGVTAVGTCLFQLTRSVGSVTYGVMALLQRPGNFNSHAPWGA